MNNDNIIYLQLAMCCFGYLVGICFLREGIKHWEFFPLFVGSMLTFGCLCFGIASLVVHMLPIN